MAVKPWRASSPRPLLHFMEEREKAVERHRFIPNSTPESSLIGTRIPERAVAENGRDSAALSPHARSGRNQWCPISPATPLVPSPLDRDGAARHLCPISAFGINLAHRRVGRAVLCPPRLPTRVTLGPGTARTEWRALPNSDSAREVTDPWVDQSRFIHPSFIGMYPVCSCC